MVQPELPKARDDVVVRCSRCLPGVYLCPVAVAFWTRFAEAETESERAEAWREYREHLDGQGTREATEALSTSERRGLMSSRERGEK